MSPTDELIPVLKKLRLSGVLQTLELRTGQSVEDELSYPEFLLRLLNDEVERRSATMLEKRLRKANFEHQKTVEDFDFHFNPSVPKSRIIDLAACHFITRKQNILLLGPSGVGKSHLAQALGHRACLLGYSVICSTAHELLKQLRSARGDGSYDRRLKRFVSPDVLILDDLGLRALNPDETSDIYELIRLRYQRAPIIVTSNRASDELAAALGDPLLASAAIDRLLHDAHVIVIEGDSYRNPPSNKRHRNKRSVTPRKEKKS